MASYLKSVNFIVTLFVLVLLVSCLDTKNPTAEEQDKENADISRVEKVYQVRIIDNRFVPDTIRIREGDTIEWINMEKCSYKDSCTHTVTFEGNSIVFDEIIEPGMRLSLQFGFKGVYAYSSKLSSAKGKVIVE